MNEQNKTPVSPSAPALSVVAGSVFVCLSSWDDMHPDSWSIKAVFAKRAAAESAISGWPKTAAETGFEPLKYKIEEWPVLSPNTEAREPGTR